MGRLGVVSVIWKSRVTTDRHTDRQIVRQSDKQTDKQSDRQTLTPFHFGFQIGFGGWFIGLNGLIHKGIGSGKETRGRKDGDIDRTGRLIENGYGRCQEGIGTGKEWEEDRGGGGGRKITTECRWLENAYGRCQQEERGRRAGVRRKTDWLRVSSSPSRTIDGTSWHGFLLPLDSFSSFPYHYQCIFVQLVIATVSNLYRSQMFDVQQLDSA